MLPIHSTFPDQHFPTTLCPDLRHPAGWILHRRRTLQHHPHLPPDRTSIIPEHSTIHRGNYSIAHHFQSSHRQYGTAQRSSALMARLGMALQPMHGFSRQQIFLSKQKLQAAAFSHHRPPTLSTSPSALRLPPFMQACTGYSISSTYTPTSTPR